MRERSIPGWLGRESIAHIKKNADGSLAPPHLLMDHLRSTSVMAGKFAGKFSSEEWGRILGFAHDVGKDRAEWQEYIIAKNDPEAHMENKGKLPHAVYGARLMEEKFGKYGRFLQYGIYGHHAGLPDWNHLESILQQYKDTNGISELLKSGIPSSLPRPPWTFCNGLDVSLWIRMLYSSLVDADFLDTESYMDPGKQGLRGNYDSMEVLLSNYNDHMKKIEEESEDTLVNRVRKEVRKRCIQMSGEPEGMFSLTVPTGGGKTLSSLGFALGHAIAHNMDRIIYVIPYTSIIEQNADVFKKAIGNRNVIEHHSNLDENDSTPESRLACENWDAPFIVTTTVQFFESLFASKPSRCRKLHNIVNSVVILDEAQLLPVEFLQPIVETLQILVDRYHVSVVLSTATQPALKEMVIDGRVFHGLKNVREIMGDSEEELFDKLKRVDFQFPKDLEKASSWESVAEELKGYDQVLCVVSTRRSARELYGLMPEGTYHLSALMCGEHRSNKLKEIKEKLKRKEPVRVISTQLVEAGVDIDFPVVYRALSGIDSIEQASGRCNREGKLLAGKVVVFVPPIQSPPGILRKAESVTRDILSVTPNVSIGPAVFERYFSGLYWKANSLDEKNIIPLLFPPDLRDEIAIFFKTASKDFRIIDNDQTAVLVPYGEGKNLIEKLKKERIDRFIGRNMQRYVVGVYENELEKLKGRGSVEEIQPGIYALTSEIEYKDDVGLITDDFFYDPEELIR